ncbi:MAG TPA: hypothetical protein EYP57_07880 [Thermodesulfobacteriaceae bacterium]|nr:hypothetical protein [Thermodesulfobacteriaceae bacterium]
MHLLKADLHIHTSEDPEDLICYSSTDLIDMARELGYEVLAITNHNSSAYSAYLRDYARERGIILIPGMEATIQGRHVLIYNMDFSTVSRSSIASLETLKRPDNLIVAAHPYFPSRVALRGLLKKHIQVFDAVELCHLYSRTVDFNRRARRVSKEYGLPMLGTSDAHQRRQLHTTYSLIEADPEPEAVIQAVKEGRVKIVSRPLSLADLVRIPTKMGWRNQVLNRFISSNGKMWTALEGPGGHGKKA